MNFYQQSICSTRNGRQRHGCHDHVVASDSVRHRQHAAESRDGRHDDRPLNRIGEQRSREVEVERAGRARLGHGRGGDRGALRVDPRVGVDRRARVEGLVERQCDRRRTGAGA